MTAFDQAWEVTKMPIYHGTSTKNLPSIMREGLKPTSQIPYAHFLELVESGYDEDDPLFMQEFGYGVADRLAEPTRYAIMAGSARDDVPNSSPYNPRQLYPTEDHHDLQFDIEDLPAIIEMPDDHMWFEDGMGRDGFGDDAWMRTAQTIPPENIRVFAQAEPDMTVGQFIEMVRNRSKEMGLEEDEDDFEFF